MWYFIDPFFAHLLSRRGRAGDRGAYLASFYCEVQYKWLIFCAGAYNKGVGTAWSREHNIMMARGLSAKLWAEPTSTRLMRRHFWPHHGVSVGKTYLDRKASGLEEDECLYPGLKVALFNNLLEINLDAIVCLQGFVEEYSPGKQKGYRFNPVNKIHVW